MQRNLAFVLASVVLGIFLCMPMPAVAAPAQSATCTVPAGQPGAGGPGIYTSIPFVGGQNCVAVGNNLQNNAIIQVLRVVLGVLAGGIGIVVAGGIIYGGFLFMTARGNAAQVLQGETVIRDAVIGLLAFLGMAAILNFLIPGGLLQ